MVMPGSVVVRSAYLLSWLAFVAVVLTADWSNARVHHVLLGLWAFVGCGAALALVSGRPWSRSVALWASFGAIAIYVYWYLAMAVPLHLADPSPGLLYNLSVPFTIWGSIVSEAAARSGVFGALRQVYWLYGMCAAQAILMLVLIERKPRRVASAA